MKKSFYKELSFWLFVGLSYQILKSLFFQDLLFSLEEEIVFWILYSWILLSIREIIKKLGVKK